MQIPKEFKGKVYFLWHVGGWMTSYLNSNLNDHADYVLLGESEDLHIQFADPRAAMAETIEAQIEKERAESAHRIAILQDSKQKFLAIEVGA